MPIIRKVWGAEVWIVNSKKYCAKLLYLDRNCCASYHYHRKKTETFFCLVGEVYLTVNESGRILSPYDAPITIQRKQRHRFFGMEDSVILEVSTYHSEKDVVRLWKSERPSLEMSG